jgi:hypothetical protein
LVILGVAVVVLRSYGKSHRWLGHVHEVADSGLKILANPLNLPEILFATALLVVLALWWLPKLQVARSQGLTSDNRFDRENEARKTLAQIVGGVFLLAGLYSSVKTFDLQRQSEDIQRQTENLQEQGQLTSWARCRRAEG